MLENIVSRGLKPNRSRLFIIDGSKGLRVAVRSMFGRRTLVQRCQVHKLRNVLGHLPDERHSDVRADMREAYKCLEVETAKRLLNKPGACTQGHEDSRRTSQAARRRDHASGRSG